MKINEIFKSIQGETTFQGVPSLFVRITGCNLRCKWCDTTYAYYEGVDYSIGELLEMVESFHVKYIVITGGEPLIQEETPLLVEQLIRGGYKVLVETGGSMDISGLHQDTFKIVDVKCPSSGMTDKMCWENLRHLAKHDEVKFIIADYNDYLWAKSVIESYNLIDLCTILISPAFGLLDPKALAEWIIQDNLNVRLQLQLHKYIWGPDAKGV